MQNSWLIDSNSLLFQPPDIFEHEALMTSVSGLALSIYNCCRLLGLPGGPSRPCGTRLEQQKLPLVHRQIEQAFQPHDPRKPAGQILELRQGAEQPGISDRLNDVKRTFSMQSPHARLCDLPRRFQPLDLFQHEHKPDRDLDGVLGVKVGPALSAKHRSEITNSTGYGGFGCHGLPRMISMALLSETPIKSFTTRRIAQASILHSSQQYRFGFISNPLGSN